MGTGLMHSDLYSLELPMLDRSTMRRLSSVLSDLVDHRNRARQAADAAAQLVTNVVDGFASGTLALGNTGSPPEQCR
jgi:hypothetical protein